MIDELYGGSRYDPGLESPVGRVMPEDTDPLALAKYGIALRDEGSQAEAETVFTRLIDLYPHLVYGWQELGVLYRRQNRLDDAETLLLRAKEIAPYDVNTSGHLSYYYAMRGRLAQALDEWLGVAPASSGNTLIYCEFLRYVAENPVADILSLQGRCETRETFVQHTKVMEMIERALRDRLPFGLIRLGDGEGAWLTMPERDEAAFVRLYEANRREMLNIWFNSDEAFDKTGFADLGRRLTDVVHNASVLGIPDKQRVAHEYGFASIRGVPSIGNICRVLASRGRTPASPAATPLFCTNDVHLDLHINGHFERLLKQKYRVGIISGHPGLGARLASVWGTAVTSQLIVPEEKSFAQVRGVSGSRYDSA